MGNILSILVYLSNREVTLEHMPEVAEFKKALYPKFRLHCGKLHEYSTLKDHGEFGKSFQTKHGEWGTGPFKEWENMIVDKSALDYKWLHPYVKDINGKYFKEDDGSLSYCKNCEAYGDWGKIGNNIMICIERCLSCKNGEYEFKVQGIQRRWREYKNINTKFEWDRRQSCFVHEGQTLEKLHNMD